MFGKISGKTKKIKSKDKNVLKKHRSCSDLLPDSGFPYTAPLPLPPPQAQGNICKIINQSFMT